MKAICHRFRVILPGILIILSSSCNKSENHSLDIGEAPVFARQVSDHEFVVFTLLGVQVWDRSRMDAPLFKANFFEAFGRVQPLPLNSTTVCVERKEGSKSIIDVFDFTQKVTRVSFDVPDDREAEATAINSSASLLFWIDRADYVEGGENVAFLRIADLATGQIVKNIAVPLLAPKSQHINVLAVSPDDKTVALGSYKGATSAGAIDLVTNKILWHVGQGGTTGITYGKDGQAFFCADGLGGIQKYDTKSGKLLWDSKTQEFTTAPLGATYAIDISPDGNLVATAARTTMKIFLWDANTGKLVRSIEGSGSPIKNVFFFDGNGKGIWASGINETKLLFFPL